ncbi:MAG: membrane-bound PQQ-dependent dehydrogenase, glucose/quinate/shikimate family [Pseudomonadota bacterium]
MPGNNARRGFPGVLLTIVAVVILLAGGTLLAGGVKLITLGGSPWYALAGGALVLIAVLLWRGRPAAAWLYLALLVLTWGWAMWETGGNGWALLPRVGFLSVLGLAFLLPPVVRHLGCTHRARAARGLLIGILVLALVGVAGLMLARPGWPDDSSPAGAAAPAAPTEWTAWGSDQGGQRFTPAAQLTPANVSGLELAWSYQSGAAPRPGGAQALAFEVTPLKIGNTLYGCTPHNVLFALDAVTGRQLWRYDPRTDDQGLAFANCRGIAYADLGARGIVAPAAAAAAAAPATAPAAPLCVRRLYTGTIDARLLAVDADTGRPCTGFGAGGAVDMRRNLSPHYKAYYYYTAAPTVSGNVVMIGSYGFDGQRLRQPSGVIRAYDLVTGAPVWAFDPARPDQNTPLTDGQFYEAGTPNSWSVSSTDEALGLIYVPMGVATPDYYGGERTPGGEKFSNAILALDNKTGKVRWLFQTVHHDIWDYDIASQPVLTDVPVNGTKVPALISISKTGETFVLDRRTGRPIHPVVERRVPGAFAPGERGSRTQPFSPAMPDFAGGLLTEAQMWGLTPFDQLYCRIEFRRHRYEGRYTPPSLKGSIQYPGFAGGVNWGSVSIDRNNGILIVNSNRLPTKSRLILPEEARRRGMVPAGPGVKSSPEAVRAGVPQVGARYAVLNGVLMSPLEVPCIQPPIGQLTAVDLAARRVLWQRPLGSADRMGPLGMASHLPLAFGVPTVGGSLTTGGGLTFIASTPDRRIHAFDTRTGKFLWQADLPANANANPMSYVGADGRQYVVIAAGGSAALASNERNVLVAFALPRR